MTRYKAIFERSETSIGNWPSHCLHYENWQESWYAAQNLMPPAGARVLKFLDDGIVVKRLGIW